MVNTANNLDSSRNLECDLLGRHGIGRLGLLDKTTTDFVATDRQ